MVIVKNTPPPHLSHSPSRLLTSQHKYAFRKHFTDVMPMCVRACAGRSVRRGASEAQPDVCGPLGGLGWSWPSAGAVGVLRWRTSEEDPAGDGEALLHPLSRWKYSQMHLIRFASPQSAEETGPLPRYYSHQHQLIKCGTICLRVLLIALTFQTCPTWWIINNYAAVCF